MNHKTANLKFEDLTKIPAYFASMNGAQQDGFYWHDKNGKQVGTSSYTEEQIKDILKSMNK